MARSLARPARRHRGRARTFADRARSAAIVGAILAAALGSPASGRGFQGRLIGKIEIETTPRLDESRIRDIIRTRVGDVYSDQAVEKDIERLHSVGSLIDISITPSLLDDGRVLLKVVAKEPAVVTRVRFEGETRVSESDLRERLQVTKGKYADAYQLSLDRASVRDYFMEQGYIHATVRQRVAPNPKGVDVVYVVDSGPRERVESVAFVGNKAFSDSELLDRMATKPRLLFFRLGKFDPEVFASDLDSLRDFCRGRGRLDAAVGYRLAQDDTMQRLFITIVMREGPQYRLKSVRIRGNRLFTRSEIAAVMKQKPGEWYVPDEIEADKERILTLYGDQGYLYAEARIRATVWPEAREVSVDVRIEEKGITYVNAIEIFGNRRTQDRVIRRTLDFAPGQRTSRSKVKDSVRRLKNTGLFQSADPMAPRDPVRIRFQKTNEPSLADAIVEVEEGRLGNISLGAGFNTNAGLVGQFQIKHNNFDWADPPKSWDDLLSGDAFAGGAQKLVLALSPGQYISDYRLSWHNPSLNDGVYSGGWDLYWHDDWYERYLQTRRGLSFTVGRRFLPGLRVSLTPVWEDIWIHNIDKEADEGVTKDVERVKGNNVKRALKLWAVLDKRNDFFYPTDGYRIEASAELAGSVLGGDVDDLKETIGAERFWTVYKPKDSAAHVLRVKGKVGFIQSLSSDGYVPIFERFFTGGMGSVRGFQRRGIGPVDDVYERHIGGKVLMLANVEYQYPVFRRIINLVFFVDAGKVGRNTRDFNLERIRVGAGVGLRIRIPQLGGGRVPIVMDLGFPVVKESTDETQIFSFSIGTGFAF